MLQFWFEPCHLVHVLLELDAPGCPDNSLSLPRPFSCLPCLVDTKCCHTDGGFHPSFERPSCQWLHNSRDLLGSPVGFVRLSLNVIVGKIKRRVRSHS